MQKLNWLLSTTATMVAMAFLSLCTVEKVHAGFFTGSISAHFENPRLQGNIRNPASFYNNASTAVSQAYGGGATATIVWGAPGYSVLNFFANQDIQVNSDEVFTLGSITYFNGTSELNSLIFGIDLVLQFVGNPNVDTLTIPISIGTTNNVGDQIIDSDFISFGSALPLSFFAFEGVGASAELKGSIVGDPYFVLSGLNVKENFSVYSGPSPQGTIPYDPSQYTTYDSPGFAGGFVGPTPSAVPEPSSLLLTCIGLAGIIRVRRCHQG
ncbi:choice-of-anchor K domain-containing protein [Schlesneria sp. T3-172]|uniref:choice-of-anchor K domain-containing protein n=1 Tax=Schlesneria sphaerica TaxID=3373610 RepID=UPI0037CB60B2